MKPNTKINMKINKLFIIIIYVIGSLVKAEEIKVSFSGILLNRFSIEFSSNSLLISLAELREVVVIKFPEAQELKFSFVNSDEVTSRNTSADDDLIKLKNETLYFILNHLADQYHHSWNYDIQKSEVVFTALAEMRPYPKRLFIIPGDISKEIGIKWGSEQELIDTLDNLGWVGEITQFNPEKFSFIGQSRKSTLDYLDMLIYVKAIGVSEKEWIKFISK